jgi:hypothetical protein
MRRRDVLAVLGGAAMNAWPPAADSQQPTAAANGLFQLQGLDHVSLSVSDGQRTIDFYRPILGQEIYRRPDVSGEFRIVWTPSLGRAGSTR